MTMFLRANLVKKIYHDLGEGGLTRASVGPYSDQGRFLFTRGNRMSGKVSGWVWDQDNLTLQEKYILLSYADHANHEGHNIYPSNELTAKKTNLSIRSIQRYTRSLEEKGFLIPDGKYQAKNGQWTNKWKIPIKEGVTVVSSLGESEGVTTVAGRGDSGNTRGDNGGRKGRHSSVTQTVIKPSIEPSEEPSTREPSVQMQLSQHFVEVSGIDWVDPKDQAEWKAKRKLWLNPLDRISALVDADIENGKALISEAIKRSNGKFTVAGPASIEKTCTAIVGEVKRGAFKRSTDPIQEYLYERTGHGEL